MSRRQYQNCMIIDNKNRKWISIEIPADNCPISPPWSFIYASGNVRADKHFSIAKDKQKCVVAFCSSQFYCVIGNSYRRIKQRREEIQITQTECLQKKKSPPMGRNIRRRKRIKTSIIHLLLQFIVSHWMVYHQQRSIVVACCNRMRYTRNSMFFFSLFIFSVSLSKRQRNDREMNEMEKEEMVCFTNKTDK